MAIFSTIPIIKFNDALLTITMSPQQAIGQWTIRFQVQKQYNGVSGLITKYVASGLNNVSGINITDSGAGVFNVSINSLDTSGLNTGTYYYTAMRTDSGSVSVLSEGFIILEP